MTRIESVTLPSPDPAAVAAFAAAIAPGLPVRAEDGAAPPRGFRGFTLSLVVPEPSAVDALVAAALEAGGTPVRPPRRSLWGYGGSVAGPDGSIWTVASARKWSSKKNHGPDGNRIEQFVLQLGSDDVAASREFYLERGLQVEKSFGRKYVQFDNGSGPITLAVLNRRLLARNAGVSPDGDGRRGIVINGAAGSFTDPDGFTWAAA